MYDAFYVYKVEVANTRISLAQAKWINLGLHLLGVTVWGLVYKNEKHIFQTKIMRIIADSEGHFWGVQYFREYSNTCIYKLIRMRKLWTSF